MTKHILKLVAVTAMLLAAFASCKEDKKDPDPKPTPDPNNELSQLYEVNRNKKAPILALEYMAPYNINLEGTGFATSFANNASGYFNWDTAISKFKNITIDGVAYHMPTQNELFSIFPTTSEAPITEFTQDGEGGSSEIMELELPNFPKQKCHDEFMTALDGGKYTLYALRFRPVEENESPEKPKFGEMEATPNYSQLSAWRYKVISAGKDQYCLLVEQIWFGKEGVDIQIGDIATPSYWLRPDARRIIPYSGYNKNGNGTQPSFGMNKKGTLWTATADEPKESNPNETIINAYLYDFNSKRVSIEKNTKERGCNVRLFIDNPKIQ